MRARLEAVPAEEDGTSVFVLRDLEELTDKPLTLSGGGMLLASLLDGKRTAAQLCAEFLKASGTAIEPEVVLGLLKALDEAGYLETPTIIEKRQKAAEFFRANPKRPAVFAGPSYPAEPLSLSGHLDAFFTAEKGPGKKKSSGPKKRAPLGMIAPHIDFTRTPGRRA